MKIGILGGAFNPPTKGHTSLIKEVLKSDLVEAVWAMPTYNHIEGKETIPFISRIRMCELAVNNLDEPKYKVQVSKFEKMFPYLKSTWHVFEKLGEIYPHHEFYMIIGMDRALDITSWYNWRELIEKVPFIVVDRNHGSFITRESVDIDWFRLDPHHYLAEAKIPDISSTSVRHSMVAGSDYDDQLEIMIDPEVYKYAQKFYN
jgi:nicotinate-nucleotide adenylyltransferase